MPERDHDEEIEQMLEQNRQSLSAPSPAPAELRERLALALEEWESNGGGNFDIEAEVICALFEEAGGLRADAVRLRNCLRNLTDGTGDGDGKLIEEGRAAVIATGYLDRASLSPASMQTIMTGNGHPDEGPCVVCGAVFDTHAEGCVFDRPPAEHEPGESIGMAGCPCCGARLEIVHGDDEPGQIGVYSDCAPPHAEAIREALAAHPGDALREAGTTTWKCDTAGDGIWSCEKCTLEWCFTEGEPEENKVKFCPECGRQITAFIRPPEYVDDEDSPKPPRQSAGSAPGEQRPVEPCGNCGTVHTVGAPCPPEDAPGG